MAAERAHNCNKYMYVMVLVVMIQHMLDHHYTTELHTYMYVHVCICNGILEDVVSE